MQLHRQTSPNLATNNLLRGQSVHHARAKLLLQSILVSAFAIFSAGALFAADNDANKDPGMTSYRAKLAEYVRARDAYDEIATPYWTSLGKKRSKRLAKLAHGVPLKLNDYVLQQPPQYSGPPEPQNPQAPSSERQPIPVVADFLRYAKAEFDFVPERPAKQADYQRAYVQAALAAGLTAEQCVRIYAFESGGNGGYDVQAGLEYDTPGLHAISTALGYNQLLNTNSVEMLAEAGEEFVHSLRKKIKDAHGPRQDVLKQKLAILKEMIAFSRTVPDRWSAHVRLGNTPKGLGIHALNLDVDIGPLLQVRKLLTSVEYAKTHGYRKPLSAAELEMMNLTGDGNGFDMVMMPDELRQKVPTSNFFQRGGYERNPVARLNNTVAKLLAATNDKMTSEAQLQGAKDLSAVFNEARRESD
jgi:hypothetical protein